MDGNGRWASLKKLPRNKGHQAGADTLKAISEFLAESTDATFLTVYAFAQANYKRDVGEKHSLFDILTMYACQVQEFLAYDARVRFVGNRTDSQTPNSVLLAMTTLEKATEHCTKFNLQIAWGYSGLDEINRAQKAGWDITRLYETMYDAPDVPPIDLLIRTGVENNIGLNWRQSDFFLLLSAGAVKVPLRCLWPDFGPRRLEEAIENWKAEAHLCGASRPQ